MDGRILAGLNCMISGVLDLAMVPVTWLMMVPIVNEGTVEGRGDLKASCR